jgi:hypothetical protein
MQAGSNPAGNRLAHRERPVVAEPLTEGTRVVPDAEPRHLLVLDRMTELVPDHLEILAVVDTTLADRDRVLLGS